MAASWVFLSASPAAKLRRASSLLPNDPSRDPAGPAWWPESLPYVAYPRARGVGESGRPNGTFWATSGIVPLYPPPPNIMVLWFHPTGIAICSLMSGAAGSFGNSAARTLQYSMARPLTTWVTKDADVTRPPRVGRL